METFAKIIISFAVGLILTVIFLTIERELGLDINLRLSKSDIRNNIYLWFILTGICAFILTSLTSESLEETDILDK
jgi:hypothetical protein